jgi:hypothetical protein
MHLFKDVSSSINPLTPELNPSSQRCPPRFLLGILIFKGLIARRFYKSLGVKGLTMRYMKLPMRCKLDIPSSGILRIVNW